jgi:secreted Zn-dependent insulinase-like peptidase
MGLCPHRAASASRLQPPRLQMHVGSIYEKEDEQGVAHFVEHVTFLGSMKREALISLGVRSNAYTDFHHTVFHMSADLYSQVYNMEMLPHVVEALAEVAFKAQFLRTRIEKERKAVLAEAQMMNTIEYRMDCQLLRYLHEENELGRLFPIGQVEQVRPPSQRWCPVTAHALSACVLAPRSAMHRGHAAPPSQHACMLRTCSRHASWPCSGCVQVKKWDRAKLRAFWEKWYFPANATLYIVGDLFTPQAISDAVKHVEKSFGGIKAGVNPDGTLKTRHLGMPPVQHAFGCGPLPPGAPLATRAVAPRPAPRALERRGCWGVRMHARLT